MRAKPDDYGTMRINAKIEIPMSLADVGQYVMSAVINGKVSEEGVQHMNKRELLRLAKSEIYDNGVEAAFEVDTSEYYTVDVVVRSYIKRMFPELV